LLKTFLLVILTDMNPSELPQFSAGQSHRSLQRRKLLSSAFDLLKFIAVVLVMVVGIKTLVFQTYEVYGQSMEPTLSSSDRLVISRVGKVYSEIRNQPYIPSRGEIIVFHEPNGSEQQIIKRVVGLPGERVVVRDGQIRVFNDENPGGILPDELVDVDFSYTNGAVDITVPPNDIFVVGDNRNPGASLDSRNDLGTVPEDYIVGNLVLRLVPLTELHWF